MPSLTKLKRRLNGWKAEGEVFERLDLRSIIAFGSSWKRCIFLDCKMSLGDARNSIFEGCRFESCVLDQALLAMCTFTDCSFVECSLEQTSFAGSVLRNTSFSDCRMAYSGFQGAMLSVLVRFARCNMHGVDLDFMEAENLVFEESNLWGAKVVLGCSFFNGAFDAESADRFVALAARMHPDPVKAGALEKMAGPQFDVVDRVMGGRE